MVGFIIRLFANIVSLLAVAKFVPGINVDSSRTLVVAALVLGLVNAVLRPFVLLLTLPLNVLSLGLLTFFINGFLFYLVSKVVKGFYVSDYLSAFLGALAFSLVSFMLNLLIKPSGTRSWQQQFMLNRADSKERAAVAALFRLRERLIETNMMDYVN